MKIYKNKTNQISLLKPKKEIMKLLTLAAVLGLAASANSQCTIAGSDIENSCKSFIEDNRPISVGELYNTFSMSEDLLQACGAQDAFTKSDDQASSIFINEGLCNSEIAFITQTCNSLISYGSSSSLASLANAVPLAWAYC